MLEPQFILLVSVLCSQRWVARKIDTGIEVTDSACLAIAIAKPNKIIKTDELNIF